MEAVEEFCHELADSDLFRGRHSTPVATIARALVAYASGRKREAARLAGVAPSTLCGWVKELEQRGTPRLLETYAHAKRVLFSKLFLDASAEIMARVREKAIRVPVNSAKDVWDLAVTGGIMADKALALRPPEPQDHPPALNFQALILLAEKGADLRALVEQATAWGRPGLPAGDGAEDAASRAPGSLHHDSER